MGAEFLIYPFLFIAIFFESFVLVTFLSKPARAARARGTHTARTPSVTIIIPCYNEAATVATTCESALALEYPKEKLEIILVNDGSMDRTAEIMARYANHPQVRIITKENGGKYTALNAGIAATHAEIIGCLDADSFVEPDALREIIPCFEQENVAAVTAAMSIHEPRTILQRLQSAEYLSGITLRHVLASVNGLYVTPGPFSFYRRSVLEKVGLFYHGHQTEDMEMALRLQREGYVIENAPRARVYTKAPDTLRKLVRQRVRWTSGFLRNVLGEYRGLIGRRQHGTLGVLVLPLALLAVGSGILLFSNAIVLLVQRITAAIEIRAGIPLSYVLSTHGSFDWFYFPATGYLLLGIAAVLASVSLIAIGRQISRTPGTITSGVFSYVLLYGFIAPLWLIRATADVALGTRRRWR